MKIKLYIIIYNIWLYILNKVHKIVNDRIMLDNDNIYVVYFSNIITDIYICENGREALELVELFNITNAKLNRRFTQVLYGKASLVFKYKMVKLTDLCFTFNASDEQRRSVCAYIADVPFKL